MRPGPDAIAALRAEYGARRDAILARLAEFAAVPAGDYFYELSYCLLTPQSSAVNAGRAIEALRARKILELDLDPAPVLGEKPWYIRFHHTKGRRLLEARRNFPVIATVLNSGLPSEEIREWLVDHVNGLGWKEASHFLRNIGHRDLAILDRHILRNLRQLGVVRQMPESLTKKRYLAIETRFRIFAGQCGLTVDELDLYFWSRETGEILK